jgi:phage I-like protein
VRIETCGRFIKNQNAWAHGKHGGIGDAFLHAYIKRRVGLLAKTTSVTGTKLVTLDGFK